LRAAACNRYARIVISFKLYDSETKREQTGEAEFAIVIADGVPMIVGAAPASKLIAALLGLCEAMVAKTGPARIPVSQRWQAVHACIGQLRAADQGAALGARAPLTATDVIKLVGEKLGPAALRDIQEAVYERVRGASSPG
jgi:hypothetical protein